MIVRSAVIGCSSPALPGGGIRLGTRVPVMGLMSLGPVDAELSPQVARKRAKCSGLRLSRQDLTPRPVIRKR